MAVLTVNQIIDNIDSFINNIKKLSKSYYVFIGRPNPWNNETIAPEANVSIEQSELSVYRDMVYGKLIFDNDVSYMIRKINWANNTVYSQYSQYDANLINSNCYVITDAGEVYKCIYNKNNSPSIIKPALNSPSGIFQTIDGYIWKYMYTVETNANTKFTTSSYVPVTVNQQVEQAAIPGTIDYITITNPGNNYQVYEEGFLQGSANNGWEVILPTTSAQVDDYYTGSIIYLKAGGGAGQIRDVAAYSGNDRRLRANTPFVVHVNLKLSGVSGNVTVGDTVTQNVVEIAHIYDQGYFYNGDAIIQTDSGASGIILSANATDIVLSPNSASFILDYPFYDTSSSGIVKTGNVSITTGSNLVKSIPVLKSGTVDIISGNTFVIANTGTNFVTDYTIGDLIRVGQDPMVNSTMWFFKTGLVTISNQSNLISAVGTLKAGGVDISAGSNTITANTGTDFVTDYSAGDFIRVGVDPMANSTAWTQRSGTISITSGSNTATAVANTSLGAEYVVGDFIKVGNNSSNVQIRQVTAVNSTAVRVSSNFSQTYISNAHYVVPADQLREVTAVNSTTIEVGSNFSQTYVNAVHYSLPRFTTDYSVGNFIQVGNTTSNIQIRQISAVNTTSIIVSNVFSQTYVANTHYLVPQDQIRAITAVNSTIIQVNTAFSQTYTANTNYWLPKINSDYAAGDYIKVGDATNSNTTVKLQIRRITAVNSTFITTASALPFAQTFATSSHYKMPVASIPTSVQEINRSGIVNFVNIDGVNIQIVNTTPVGKQFIAGEKIVQVDVNDNDQGAKAIVSFANSSEIQLASVDGTFVTGNTTASFYVRGLSSNVKSQIYAVVGFPNITVERPNGEFVIGRSINVVNTANTDQVFANATVVSISTTPDALTEYVISPKVLISGDGNNALAYAYVDESSNNPSRSITEIRLLNYGNNYTIANVVISSNGLYGEGATAVASISPANGHGSNTYMELGAKYAGISVTFGNGSIENYKFPVNGKFRRIGIIEDPTFDYAQLTLDSFDRVKLYLANTTGTEFIINEVVLQPNTGKAGVVVYSNVTAGYLELKNILDTENGLPFYTTAANSTNLPNTVIYGLTSGANATVLTLNGSNESSVSYFSIFSNVQSVSEITSGATASIRQTVNNTVIVLSDIKGHFNANDTLYDATINAYANVVSISIANGNIDATTNFGHKFNQTCRIPLHSNSGLTFSPFETVVQEVSNAAGTVLSYNVDRDIVVTAANGTFSPGDVITSSNVGTNTATAIVTYASTINGSYYVRCTAANGTIGLGETVTNQLDVGGTIANVYPALVLYNVYNNFDSSEYQIVGQTSGAFGKSNIVDTIVYPELVRGSGMTSYLENVVAFERSNGSVEKINIVIKF